MAFSISYKNHRKHLEGILKFISCIWWDDRTHSWKIPVKKTFHLKLKVQSKILLILSNYRNNHVFASKQRIIWYYMSALYGITLGGGWYITSAWVYCIRLKLSCFTKKKRNKFGKFYIWCSVHNILHSTASKHLHCPEIISECMYC